MMEELVKTLHNLFVVKTKDNNVEVDKTFLARVSACQLLRAFIDPDVPIKFVKGYVPHRMELEMVYAAIRSAYPSKDVSSEALLIFALDRIGVYGGFERDTEVKVNANDKSSVTS